MRLKKEKTKLLLEKKRGKHEDETLTINESQLNDNMSVSEEDSKCLETHNVSKKEMKAIRNRISAQLSRDRKKKEFDDLQRFSQKILDENKNLKRELTLKNRDIINLKNQLSKVCKNCSTNLEVPNSHNHIPGITTTSNPVMKYGIVTSFLVVVCIIAACFYTPNYTTSLFNNFENSSEELTIRNLVSNPPSEVHSETEPTDKTSEDDHMNEIETNVSENEIEIHQEEHEEEEIQITENQTQSSNALMTREELRKQEFIDYAVFANKKFQVGDINLSKYLNKKRDEYLNKMNERLYLENKIKNEKKFLRKQKEETKKNLMCLNTNKFLWSVKEEIAFEDELLNNNITTQRHYEPQNTSVIPIADLLIENQIKESIKSILCPNFVANSIGMFNTILNNKINQTTTDNDLDCVYMHLLFPGEDDYEKIYANGERKKYVFYEVVCKIYEINKIYK